MTHEDHKDALALVALGEDAGPELRDALEVHLAACGECRAELRDLSDAAALLALSAEPARPSPELRSRILAEIKMAPQERGAAGDTARTPRAVTVTPTRSLPDDATAAQTATDAEATQGAGTTAAKVIPFDAGRRAEGRGGGGRRPLLFFGYLAASLALGALCLSLAMLWQRNNQLRSDLARLSAELEQTRSQLGETRTEMARVSGEAEMLAAPDSHVAELTGTEVAAGARARLTFNETTGEAVLVAAKLPQPPAGKAYQLWYIADNKPLPGPVFTTDPSGRGQLRERIPPEGRRAALFAVTLEPAAGLPAPSGEMYLKGPASGPA